MKKISLTFIVIMAMVKFSFAQWSPGAANAFYYTTSPINIGGSASPLATLQVTGNVLLGGTNTSPGSGYNTNILAGTKQMLIGWNRSGGAGETDFISNQGAGSIGGFSFYNHDNSDTETLLMNISGNGNVGIGVSPGSTYKLNVNGGIHAKQVTVDLLGFPDYVFNYDYALPTLSFVKSYIKLNHHLPDMPSAQKIAAEGLNLGEIDKLLTQKVEELTLYLIEKDQQLNDQKKVNDEQQKQIDLQEERIKKLEEALTKLTARSESH